MMSILFTGTARVNTSLKGLNKKKFTQGDYMMKSIRMVRLITIVVLILVPGLVTHVSTATGTQSINIYVDPSANPSAYQQPVTFRVSLGCPNDPSGSCRAPIPAPLGAVTIYVDTIPTASASVSDYSAEVTVTGLSLGQHWIYARYFGDDTYADSSSGRFIQYVGYGTTTTITSSDNPDNQNPNNINPVSFTAHVVLSSNNAPVTTGRVDFVETESTADGRVLQFVLGSGDVNSNGDATFTPSPPLAVGSHSITAVYNGCSSCNGGYDDLRSTSDTLNQIISLASTNTTTNLGGSPIIDHNPVSLIYGAQVTYWDPFVGDIPVTDGTVTFWENTTQLETDNLDSHGFAPFHTTLPDGSHNITAVFNGCPGAESSSSASVIQVVEPMPTTTSTNLGGSPIIDHDPISITYGAQVTYWDSITQSNAPVTDGTVTFWENTTQLETDNLDSHGFAPFHTTLPDGSHNITAVYNGGDGWASSTSDSVIQVVEPMSTSTSVTTNQNPVHFGDPVTFIANVTYLNFFGPVTDGTVTFNDGTTTLGTGTLNSSGNATFTTSSLAVGSHSITAVYNGGDGWATSTSGNLTQTVLPVVTTTTVASSATPSIYGQPVHFTATVSSNFGTPAGTVQFFSDGAPFGSAESLLPNGNASSVDKADIPVSGSPHNVTAVFSSTNPNYAGSQGKVDQTVNQAPTSTAVVSNKTPTVYGEPVRFTATVAVSAPGAGIPTGTVTFTDGTTTIGTGTLNITGGTYLDISSLSVGSHIINASYNGDSNFTGSWQTISQTVNKASTTTTVNSSRNPSVYSQLAPTFTETVVAVAPGSGTPTGTVTFKDGTRTLGTGTLSGGSATFTPSKTALSVGIHSITAVYAGDTNFLGSTSLMFTQTVNPPPKITAYVPTSGKRGAAAFKFVISGSGFQNGATVSLTKTGVPAIAATSVSVSSTKNSITCLLKIPSNAPTGSRSVTVTNPDGGTVTVSGFTVK
jgi:hypothetical protein